MKKTFPVTAAAAVVSLWTLAGAAHAAPAPVTQTYNRPGSYTFTVPDGVKRVTLWVVGAGGGGGGNNNGDLTGGGGGGGASGSQVTCSMGVRPHMTLTMTVGKGGSAGTAGATNTDGGDGGTGGDSSAHREGELVARAGGGGGGFAGHHSGTLGSGTGGAAGQAPGDGSCVNIKKMSSRPAAAGDKGENGSRNNQGKGGWGGRVDIPGNTGARNGTGGQGGNGAGIKGGSQNPGEHVDAHAGEQGNEGLIKLTYTPQG